MLQKKGLTKWFLMVIERFVVRINPVIFRYERECILTLRNIDKTIKEQEILNR